MQKEQPRLSDGRSPYSEEILNNLGISKQAMKWRLERGMSPDEAAVNRKRPGRRTAIGEWDTISLNEAARILDIEYAAFWRMIKAHGFINAIRLVELRRYVKEIKGEKI